MISLPRTPEANARRIEAVVGQLAASCRDRPVFLVDGDRTLTPDDTSRTFLTRAGLDPLVIKRRFERDGYVFEAFRFHADVHVALGEDVFARLAPEVAREAPMYPGSMEFLRAARGVGRVFVVSAGIPRIWRALLDSHQLDDVGVIGGVDPALPYVFGRREKGLVARLFLAHGARVVSVGDSEVDADMLFLSHHAVVVVNHRQNADLMPHLLHHPSRWQVVPRGVAHSGVPELAFPSIARLGQSASFLSAESPACP